MAVSMKGITVEFRGDTSKLSKALGEVRKDSRNVSTELKQIENSLKFNPDNVTLLEQKEKNLKRALDTVEEEAKLYREALQQLDDKKQESGQLTEEEQQLYDRLERDLLRCKNQTDNYAQALSEVKSKLEGSNDELEHTDEAADDAADALEKAGDSAEGAATGGFTVLKGALADLVSAGIQKALDFVGDLVDDAISASDSLQKFGQTMEFAGFDPGEVDAAREAVQQYADDTVYELDTIANTTAQLAANGIDDYTGLTQAAGNLNAVAGGSAETFNSVAGVLTQTAGAGKLTTENWNQLANAIPGASGILMDKLEEMGAYTGDFREAMAAGEITAEEFNAAIMEVGNEPMAVEAATSVSTFEGAMGNLEATVINALMAIYDGIGSENITGFITGIADGVNELIPYIQTGMGYVQGFIGGMGPMFSGLSSSMAGPMEAISIAFERIQEAIGPVVETWAPLIASYFTNVIAPSFGYVVAIIGDLIAFFLLLVDSAGQAVQGVVNWFQQLPTNVQAALNAVRNTATSIFNTVRSTISNAINGAKNAVSSALNAIKSAFNTAKSSITSAVNAIKNVIGGIGDKIQSVKDKVQSGIDKIKSIINGAHLSLPKFKVPYFKISGGKLPWGIGGQGTKPSISVEWYAKGGIFDVPAIIGVGERGPEAVLPIDRLSDLMASAISELGGMGGNTYYVMNVDGAVVNSTAEMRSQFVSLMGELIQRAR